MTEKYYLLQNRDSRFLIVQLNFFETCCCHLYTLWTVVFIDFSWLACCCKLAAWPEYEKNSHSSHLKDIKLKAKKYMSETRIINYLTFSHVRKREMWSTHGLNTIIEDFIIRHNFCVILALPFLYFYKWL